MMNIKDILRYRHDHALSRAQIVAAVGVSTGTVSHVPARAEAAGLSWPLPPDLDDEALRARLYPVPDLDDEALAQGGKAYTYSHFCALLKENRQGRPGQAQMRFHYAPGLYGLSDFSGKTLSVLSGRGGKDVEIFVAMLSHSNMIYAEAVPDQSVHHWTMAHRRALEAFGGVPERWMPDDVPRNIIGHHDLRNLSHVLEAAHMRGTPVLDLLGQRRFDIESTRHPHRGHEHLCLVLLAVDRERHGHAGVVNKQTLAG